jgi:hypothetical protein
MRVHKRDVRLYVNAGMPFPLCAARAEFLDLDKGRWFSTGENDNVTCGNCLRILGIKREDNNND